jgi:hypothetical protein
VSRTYEELAGVVDLFGALTPDELERALDELAFKQGSGTDSDALVAAVDDAVEAYYLVEYDPEPAAAGSLALGEADSVLVVGPVAFPTLPENAEDLPHIMDVPEREVDREAVGRQVAERLLADAARAVAADDTERVDHLLDVSYDLEAWAPVDVDAVQDRLHDALAD